MKDAIVFFGVIFGGLLVWLFMQRERPMRYRKRSFLTGTEREFYMRLQRALPDCLVCPKVAVSALLEPMGVGKTRRAALANIVNRRVGYAVFDEDMELLAIVELDHRSRPNPYKAATDTFFASAGIRTIRFQAKRLPSDVKIYTAIYERAPAATGPRAYVTSGGRGEIEFRRPKTPWRNTLNAHI